MNTISYIRSFNDNAPTQYKYISSVGTLVGDALRLVTLFLLGSFVFSKKSSSFKYFLLAYALSSVFVGFFEYNHGHTARGFSEYILALLFFVFYLKY